MAGMGYHTLKLLLNLGEIQDQLFGPNSVGGLTWDDYLNIVPYTMDTNTRLSVLHGKCDEFFPFQCQEFVPIEEVPNAVEVHGTEDNVGRCEGRKVDDGVAWRTPNQNFPGNVELRLRRTQDYFPKWDPLQPFQSHHQRYPPGHALSGRCIPGWGVYPVCHGCYIDHYSDDDIAHRENFPHNSAAPLQRRWARLCKRHALFLRQYDRQQKTWPPRLQATLPENQAAIRLTRSTCACHGEVWFDGIRIPRICLGCSNETSNALQDRARYWRNQLMHTHRRQRRGARPYVDFRKPERREPACAFRNCGRQAWIGTREAEIMGLSVCLACSKVVVS